MKNLKIATKILVAFVAIAIVSLGLVGYFSFNTGVNTLEKEAFNKLTAIREMKANQIEEYFSFISDQVITFSQDRMIIDAMGAFEETHEVFSADLEISNTTLAEWETNLEKYYRDEFLERLLPNLNLSSGSFVHVNDYLPEEDEIVVMQSLYIGNNPNPTGSKDELVNPGDGSRYSAVHETYHPIIRDYLNAFGYYDIFLVDASSGGHIVYSVFKEVDFGTSLINGPYANTNFGRAYRAALEAKENDFVMLVDYESYHPSYNAPAAFIASPIFAGSEKIGVLIFQMPIDKINNIMTNNQDWESVGLGESGETYIVGEDYLLRNQSRFLIEDSENYFESIKDLGTSEIIISKIRNLNSTIGLQRVETAGTIAALAGNTETAIFPDYRDISVFSAYKPLEIDGVNWAIMSEKNEAEVFQPMEELVKQLSLGILGLFALIVFLGLLFSRSLTKPITTLNNNATELAKGNLDHKVVSTSNDEIGGLSKSFEIMRRELKKSISDLEDINTNLEDLVDERTKELELSDRKSSSIIESAGEGIVVIDQDSNIILWNKAAENIFDYKADEILGEVVTKIIPPWFVNSHEEAMDRASDTGKLANPGHTHEVEGLRKDGTAFPMELTVSQWAVANSVYYSGVLRDISERKKAEAQLRFLSEALASAADGVAIIDKEDRIQWVNKSFSDITGYQLDEVIDQPITILNSGEHTDKFLENISATTAKGEIWRGEIIQKRKDGSFYTEALSVSPLLDQSGEIENFVSIRQDITERKELERQLEIANERMSEELNFAQEIQMSMLPLIFPAFPTRSEFNIYAHLIPAREVGGDFYDFYFLDEDHLCFVIGDVSGKGAPGALLMAVSKTLIKSRAMDDFQPSSILTHVNNELSQNNDSAMFVTVFLGVLEIQTGRIVYCNAGHNPPFIRRQSGKFEKLDDFHGPVIGALPNLSYKESSTTLNSDEIIVLHTDGVTEAFNPKEDIYSDERYENFLNSEKFNSPQKLVDQVVRDVKQFENGAAQADDITMLALQYRGASDIKETGSLDITIKNKIEELAKVEEKFEVFCQKQGIEDSVRQKVSIVLDELLNNIVNYAFRDDKEHDIEVRFVLSSNRLVVTLHDDGVPFNPFELDPPDLSLSLDEREIGGLGIMLVRNMMDEYLYSRHIGKNVVRLVKLTNKD